MSDEERIRELEERVRVLEREKAERDMEKDIEMQEELERQKWNHVCDKCKKKIKKNDDEDIYGRYYCDECEIYMRKKIKFEWIMCFAICGSIALGFILFIIFWPSVN